MPEEIVMPRLSDTMEEGTIAQWLKREGETVHKGEAILEVETDKANMELQAYSDGVIQKILQDDGATVPIGTVVGLLAKVGEKAAPAAAPARTRGRAGGRGRRSRGDAPRPGDSRRSPGNGGRGRRQRRRERRGRRPRQSLAARAQPGPPAQHRPGRAGPGQRARRAHRQGRYRALLPARAPEPSWPRPRRSPRRPSGRRRLLPRCRRPQPVAAGADDVELRKPNRIQQVMARRLVESKTTVPHFYVTNEVDMAAAMDLRKQLQATFGDEAKSASTT